MCCCSAVIRCITEEAVCWCRISAMQLDGFGHSSSEPLLKSMGGFEALFFGS
jgi:hypothetical protein